MHTLSSRCLLLAAVLTLVVGCNPPQFRATTVVRSDGSCERTIVQPRDGYLPRVARPAGAAPDSTELSPEWVARWTSVTGAEPAAKKRSENDPRGKHSYFEAHGTFASPADIPLHYLYANKATPESGLSALTREFERTDFGLFIEYRWTETVTNSLTRERFLTAIAEFVQIVEPFVTSGLPAAMGDAYDAEPLISFLRNDAPEGIVELAATYYDARIHRFSEKATIRRLLEVLRRHGFVVDENEGDPIERVARDAIQRYVRRSDGKTMTGEDVTKIFELLDKFDWKAHEEKIGIDEDRITDALNGAFGIYPLLAFPKGAESFDYSLELPGTMLESNGVLRAPSQVFWRFSAGDTFPAGYEMTARSILYNLDIQKKVCGRVVADNARAVEKFIELTGREGPLLEAVREACAQRTFKPIQNLRVGKDLSAGQINSLIEFLHPTK